jgi:predicted DNA-binding ribbon-helix-helix protein
MGTAISGKFDLNEAFWQKMEKINQRKSKMINACIVASIDW